MTISTSSSAGRKKARRRLFMAQPVLTPSGVYQLRRKVPPELLAVLGREYKRSLKTRDPVEAKARFAEEWTRSEVAFALARARQGGAELLTPRDIELLAGRWYRSELLKVETSGDFGSQLADGRAALFETAYGQGRHVPLVSITEAMQEDPDLDISPSVDAAMNVALRQNGISPPVRGTLSYDRLASAFRTHFLQLSEIVFKRSEGDWISEGRVLPDEPLSFESRQTTAENRGKRLLSIFEGYAQDKILNDGNVRSVLKTLQGFRATVEQFAAHFGDLPIRDITRDVIREYRKLIAQLPAKGEGLRNLNLLQLIAEADARHLPRVQEPTTRNKLRTISAVLGYAVRMGDIHENAVIAGGFAKAAAKAAANREAATKHRRDYNFDELESIFTSPIYTEDNWSSPRADFGAAWYWMPLLMYYTGARREELAQLAAKDVLASKDGIWHLSILALEGDDDAGRSVKTVGSRRVIPIHPHLIELGLLAYSVDQEGGQLFPLLKADPKGYYGTNFGKRWACYLRDTVGLKSPAKPSHGFRHTFKTLSRGEGISEDVHDAITGHSGQGSIARDYGMMPLSRMATEIARFPRAPLKA